MDFSGDSINISERQKVILAIYKRFNNSNAHKMNPIPVCKIPTELLGLLD